MGILSPDSGFISIAELDPLRDWRKIRSFIGFVPQETSLYPELTGFQNLEFHCAMYLNTMKGFKDKVNTILKLVDLHHRSREKVRTYSGGMKRRLAIGRALLHDPEIIILDEPTLGVDVQGSHKIWEYIKGLAEKGKTVIVTTNVMSEADFLCDNLLIIDNGTNIAMGTVDELKSSIGKKEIIIRKKPSLDDVFLHYTGRNLRD